MSSDQPPAPALPRDRLAVLITAAGRGTRMGGEVPKQWLDLAGRSVLARSIDAFAGFDRIIVTVHPGDMDLAIAGLGGRVTLVAGGETRSDSVRAGLKVLEGSGITHVLIHDGARPLVAPSTIGAVVTALAEGAEAAAPGLAVTDALWRGDAASVTGFADRRGLFRAQTPQGFSLPVILAAHRAAAGGAADDVELVQRQGVAVRIVPGDEDNLKITWPGDMERAGRILRMRGNDMDVRLGNGYDVHAFGPGDHVWLCGVQVPHDKGLMGHSDADVGMHALTDAIYGALAQGDIGRHFPPSDPQWKGAASEIFLRHAAELARSMGYRLGNADVTLICERPKIGPHAGAMQAQLAEIMGVEAGRVSVKATTSERLGFTGREEGIASIATATLIREA
ncbi:bifunctional 2-C-methyl-D-erythritol 4-phosphate cytidylyltransferase/2-C-methyl-D-erythritol 2,4-cyclodiphosphate synthase [Paracoccus sp. (in: a-proteobacteria)]|uniref:bifunctional 2-C-methyl-D-erythritol 4-phosphate cytidylyltransferase/2-C-methyl-D-erythritol 2,4-cyclodiphosphate synthase n=1 Tax=Paracoccus sp. TaxID=267 RepID=UPI0026E097BA|nr:bifunctional 2-C-methyl-D-erythritol 4-phosphate cytidylyltransferase/2-C-methyl-D-erythritol 2,4-cyclodiphosphate synthase [Paracoccus sp. (in: a-proteobacteria)]MDO5370921.1 bifunctional 2-C-methyl-D-erythritol 4-phosphate cytidylyltransferase/2-C-methyl-D-erythritol 2,4-cyclodiphosphate synthase [Paracoccus sp. (in: a-proteobacteria)]